MVSSFLSTFFTLRFQVFVALFLPNGFQIFEHFFKHFCYPMVSSFLNTVLSTFCYPMVSSCLRTFFTCGTKFLGTFFSPYGFKFFSKFLYPMVSSFLKTFLSNTGPGHFTSGRGVLCSAATSEWTMNSMNTCRCSMSLAVSRSFPRRANHSNH